MPVQSTRGNEVYITDNYLMRGSQTLASTKTQVQSTWTDTRITQDNPSWRQQVKRGINATTPFSAISYSETSVPVHAYMLAFDPVKGDTIPRRFYVNQRMFGLVPDNPSGYSDLQADRQARQSFVSNYRQTRTAFQSGVFLGELMQTVRMIKSPAKSLRDSISDYVTDVRHGLKRRSRGAARRRFVQESWLEYAYGVRPLVSDVGSLSKLACAHPYASFQPLKGQSSSQWKTDVSYQNTNATVIGLPYWYRARWLENSMSVRYIGAIRAQNSPPSFPEQLGLSWSNVLPTAWELIPHSFLVDYFSNVGKVIEGISTGRINLAWGCRNTKATSTAMVETFLNKVSTTNAYASTKWTGYATGSGATATYKYVTRKAVEGVGVGLSDLAFKLPGSGTQWLNLAALASMRVQYS